MKIRNVLLLLMVVATAMGCGSPRGSAGGGAAGGGGTGGPPVTATQLVLTASSNTVKSDNSNISVITATALDANNAVVNGATVSFSTSVGQLSTASGITGATGSVTANLSSGANKFNQTATVSASLTGAVPAVSVQVPVQIIGSSVSLASLTTNVTAAITDTLTITVRDAGNNPIANAPVTIAQAGSGSLSLAPTVFTTNASGTTVATVTGVTPGNVTLTVSAAGATATKSYVVTNPAGAFAITSPATDPFPLSAGTPVVVTVQVPVQVPPIANVSFAASMGAWNGGALSTVTVPVVAGAASATFSSTQSGVATIQVFDAANLSTTDKIQIAVSQPAINAAQVILQANVNVVAPSVGGLTHTATLTANVRDVNGQAVGGSAVVFTILNSVGGGETVSPVVVMSDSFGKAVTTFTSGAVSTGAQGVNIQAALLANPAITGAVNIAIGGTAGSVAIGRASGVTNVSASVYELPMSVLVADSNGNAVAGASVTLKSFPIKFRMGKWTDTTPLGTTRRFLPCFIAATATTATSILAFPAPTTPSVKDIPNEDLNRDLILNPGEDMQYTVLGRTCDSTLTVIPEVNPFTFPGNSRLDPPNSAAGTLPQTVITDASGVANFVLTYLKGSAQWIETEITASTLVLGSETTSKIKFTLPSEKVESEAGLLPNSVFGQ